MCCGNKTKPRVPRVNPASMAPTSNLQVVPAAPLSSNAPIPITANIQQGFGSPYAGVPPGIIPGVVATTTQSALGGAVMPQINASRAPINTTLQKSQVRCQQINDPTVRNFFKDCTTQRVQLTKIMNQHNSYVRHHDYFDLSNGHYSQLNNLRSLQDPKLANYGTSESTSLSTPNINRFVYTQDVPNVHYVPKTPALKMNYDQYARPAVLENIGEFDNRYSAVQQSTIMNPVQPVNVVTYNTGPSANMGYSTIQPNSNIVGVPVVTNQVQPTNTYMSGATGQSGVYQNYNAPTIANQLSYNSSVQPYGANASGVYRPV